MKVAFVLDGSINQTKIEKDLRDCYDNCSFYDVSSNYKDLLQIQPDLLFINIDFLGISLNALLSMLESIHFNFVIVSSNPKFAIKAFQFGALHYIVTPITSVDIVRVKLKMPKNKLCSVDESL